ncbi:hypothetical protein ACXYUI_28475, partial [Klebsiella pneumoniae]
MDWLLNTGQTPAARAAAATVLQQWPKVFSARWVAAAVGAAGEGGASVVVALSWLVASPQFLPERAERLLELLFRFDRL